MIEPKEHKLLEYLIEIIEYKINSVTNYIKNYEYPEAKRELSKAEDYLHFMRIIYNN